MVTISVNGELLDSAAIDAVRGELLAQDRAMALLAEEQQQQRAEEALIERTLVRQTAQKSGPAVRAVDVKREVKRAMANAGGPDKFQQFLDQSGVTLASVEADIELRMKIDGLLDQICAGLEPPDEAACRAFYDAHPDLFMTEEHVRASHIVRHCAGNALEEFAAHAELKAVLEKIHNGTPFESFTRHCSDCPDDEGDLGYFARGMMVPEFEEVVFALQPGEVSGVFKTPFGLHIAKLIDRLPPKPRPYDDVKDEVRRHLFEQAENACIDEYTANLKQNASIVRED